MGKASREKAARRARRLAKRRDEEVVSGVCPCGCGQTDAEFEAESRAAHERMMAGLGLKASGTTTRMVAGGSMTISRLS